MKFRFKLPHFHSDPDYRRVNVHYLYECRCGAKRTRRAYSNIDGPIHPDWPSTTDRHGTYRMDSGWVSPTEMKAQQ